jgi:hypothetical protein
VEKGAKAIKATTATTKIAKATKATTKIAKAAKTAKGAKIAKATKATTKIAKAAKTAKGAKAAKPAKAAKSTKVAKISAGDEAVETSDNGKGPAGSRPEALNEPMTFLTFVADHPVGSTFDGTVVSFTSHGAHVDVDGMLCHVPLRGLAVPPPKKARQVLSKGETMRFQLVSLDAARRRAELVLPGVEAE